MEMFTSTGTIMYKLENYVATWNHINGKIIQQYGTI